MRTERVDGREDPLLEAGVIPVINFCDFANVYVIERTLHFYLVRRRLLGGERVREPVAELIAPAEDVAQMARRMELEVGKLMARLVGHLQ
jgi:hypothetical protein